MKRIYFLIILTTILASCDERNTTNPMESFTHWAGLPPHDSLRLLNGTYWESAHWAKEYEVYLQLIPTEKWWNTFIQQNALIRTKEKWSAPNEAPSWFRPTPGYRMYYLGESEFNNSRYFRDSISGDCYIYEIQL